MRSKRPQESHRHIECGMSKVDGILRLQQILLGLGLINLGAQQVGRNSLPCFLPGLRALKVRLRGLERRFRYPDVFLRQEFVRVRFHDVEDNFLPGALHRLTGRLGAEPGVLDAAARLAGVI